MLKLIRGLILCLVVIAANAYVPPTYAASATIVITHIQAGGTSAPLQEFVMLYNNSTDEVDITGWCLKNKNQVSFGCFKAPVSNQRYFLAGHGFATVGSNELGIDWLDVLYAPTNKSSGDIIGSSETLSLVDQTSVLKDSYSWTGLAGGALWARKLETPVTYLDTDQPTDWELGMLQGIPSSGVLPRIVNDDLCINIEGVQTEVPTGLELKFDGRCVPPASELLITELLPNASGSDDGREFIEIYNPHDQDISLDDYILKVGPSFEATVGFPKGSIIAAHSYKAFSNTDIRFSLLNSSSRVQLKSVQGVVLYETPSYQDPADDMAWALINGIWQYTDYPTPGAENQASDDETNAPSETVSLQPCAANQYRSPETNRCRLIATTTSTPCKDGQYRSEETGRCRKIADDLPELKVCAEDQERNPETGRCRKIAVLVEPTPCKEGQERNPETNRCRNSVAVTKADYAVLGTTTENNNWYLWAAIGGLLLAAIGYAVWEWRDELRKVLRRVLKFVRIRK